MWLKDQARANHEILYNKVHDVVPASMFIDVGIIFSPELSQILLPKHVENNFVSSVTQGVPY